VKPRPDLKIPRNKIFPTACRIPVWPFVVVVKAGQRTCRCQVLHRRPAIGAPLRKQPGAEVVITDGPYLETKEHIGGFWILDAANKDEAVAWGRKAVVACRAPVEVREFLAMPTE
jgi:hypothetical protein